jgi:hypothetical protein
MTPPDERDCPACDGEGCIECGDTGKVPMDEWDKRCWMEDNLMPRGDE